MKDFLIVKTSSIGDVIQCFHLVDFLQMRFPKCKIDWVVEKGIAPLLRAHPGIDRIIEINSRLWRKNAFKHRREISSSRKELRKKTYDALFDLQGNTKSGLITGLTKARKKVGYSWSGVAEKPNFLFTTVHISVKPDGSVRSRYLQLVQDFFGEDRAGSGHALKLGLEQRETQRLERLRQLGFQRPRIMVCFGSNWNNKMLSEKVLTEFLQRIDEKLAPSFFFIFGNDKEKEIADRLESHFSRNSHAVGNLSLPLWQRFMSEVEGVISMDSAALHLCATTSTPSFSLFGPSSADAYKPLGEKHYAFQGKCPYEVSFEKRCPHLRSCTSGACLKDVSIDDLSEQFQGFWNTISERELVLN